MSEKTSQSHNATIFPEVARVAYSGRIFNYTYLAANSLFSLHTPPSYIPCDNLKDVFKSLQLGNADYAVVPIESSSNGTIHCVYDNLLECNGTLSIIGEIGSLENHCLCVKEGTTQADITKVVCHPHILEGCSEFLDAFESKLRKDGGANQLFRIASWDSGGACEQVANDGDPHTAAIASREAAAHNNLKIINNCVNNDLNAETRYILIARIDPNSSMPVDPLHISSPNSPTGDENMDGRSRKVMRRQMKRSIVLALKNAPGAIFRMSSCFALRDVNILKIESRPATTAIRIPDLPLESRTFTHKHWDLIFYVDYEPSSDSTVNQNLLKNLQEYCLWVRELGEYHSGLQTMEAKPAEWNNLLDLLAVTL